MYDWGFGPSVSESALHSRSMASVARAGVLPAAIEGSEIEQRAVLSLHLPAAEVEQRTVLSAHLPVAPVVLLAVLLVVVTAKTTTSWPHESPAGTPGRPSVSSDTSRVCGPTWTSASIVW